MRVLIVGDIIGDIGVKKVREFLPEYKKSNKIDFVIANGENSSERNGNKYKNI